MAKSNKQYVSSDRLKEAIISDAKRFGHHGPKNLCEVIFQRQNVVISFDYAKQLCRNYTDWKG